MIYRPHYVAFPKDKNGFAIDDQYYIGYGLLVKPIAAADVKEIQVYLPEDQVRYSPRLLFELCNDGDSSGFLPDYHVCYFLMPTRAA